MKKITLFFIFSLLLTATTMSAQVINEPANWPNTNWTITGSYDANPLVFTDSPLTSSNFSFDDDEAGGASNNNIAAESNTINLTNAYNNGETLILINASYIFNKYVSEILTVQYYNADSNTWENFDAPFDDSPNAPSSNFCAGQSQNYTSTPLNISSFTSNQLTNFKYRISYDDNDIFGWGFCFNSPTLYSQVPPDCGDVNNVVVSDISDSTVNISWQQVGIENSWEIAIQAQDTGIPSSNGTVTSDNPYSVNGLNPNSNYEVYIRAICPNGGYSNWLGPVNFQTTIDYPDTPVGANCGSESAVYIFTEDFNSVSGWTGDLNNGNGSWEIPNDSATTGTGAFSAHNGDYYMNYEASGNSNASASAISPAIDLTDAVNGAELSFYMHAYGENMGTLQVNIANSVSGPFTNLFTWNGQLQESASDDWIPVGVNLDAYLGQIIYIEFNHTGTGAGYLGDMSIDYVRVETCGSFCIAPSSVAASNITTDSAHISWNTDNSTAWEYVIQTPGAGVPSSSGTATTTNSFNADNLLSTQDYEVYIRTDCGNNEYSNWNGPLVFTTLTPSRVHFTTQPIGSSGYDLTVVDMNGDYLDDIVGVSNTNINIQQQNTNGTFTNINITTPNAAFLPGWSMAAADYDANGYTDLLYAAGSGVTFMKANSDGTGFTEYHVDNYVFSQRSNFSDINNDGHLDAFVCHDVQPNVYYINDGNGNLTYYQTTDSGAPYNLGDYPSGGNYGSIWVDYDNDRDMDMFIAKCGGETPRRTNQMHTKNADGTFTENAAALGIADPIQTWSASWADYDNDGDMDLFVGSSSGSEAHKLMRNDGASGFTDVSVSSGVSQISVKGHENVSYDFDNDGYLDIACNGVILYGNGDLTFTEIDDDELNYKNGSFGDLNNDGFIDAYYNGNIYWNGTTDNNWIKIVTVGTASNINGIGARVELTTNAGTQIRDVRSGEGFEFMSTLNTHFGLGTEATINNIVVYWPSGTIDVVNNPNINETLVITEGSTLTVIDETLSDVSIYPNPVENELKISTTADITNKIATVFDINGKKIMNERMTSNTLNVSSLQNGVYFLRLESNGKSIKRKFIKK